MPSPDQREIRPLSVIITTFNEEVNVAECIESSLWADEVLVVDSFSTDKTVEIAKSYPVTVMQREYFGSAAQKNWSLDRVEHDWVLILDADERVTPELALEIQGILALPPRANGYYIRRKSVVLGKAIKHSGWSTDKVIRLFDRAHGRYPNRRVHADVDIDGDVPTLKSSLLHYTYRTLDQYFQKLMNYADWGAAQAFREGRRAGFVAIGGRTLWRFVRTYFLQLGILDGLHGLIICSLQATGVFLKYARLWEYGVRTRLGQEIDLPAFDDNVETWERPGEKGTLG